MKRAFGPQEKLALLVWTREDVEAMTEQEVDAILCAIGNVGLADHTDEGVSCTTVREMLAGKRCWLRLRHYLRSCDRTWAPLAF